MLRTASSLPPYRAFDAGLRPRPFPGETASLLPGLLAATRTGLPPAGDDELTNTKNHHGTTSRCHLPFCWAHEKTSLRPLFTTRLPRGAQWSCRRTRELYQRPPFPPSPAALPQA